MAEKPDYVKNFERPKNTEIKQIHGRWYLYERKSAYDPIKKRSKKVSGPMIGTITPDGLVPKKVRLEEFTQDIQCVEYGASTWLYELSYPLQGRLQEHFPSTWKPILALAILRCLGENVLKRVDGAYESSFLSQRFGKLSLSSSSLSTFLRQLGKQRQSMISFMQEDFTQDQYILVDGHRILSHAKGLPYAQFGYDSRRRYKTQLNLLYLFSGGIDARKPLYYKVFEGSVPDCTAFPDLVGESSLRASAITVVGDKGFGSQEDLDTLLQAGLHFIVPLKRNSARITYPDRLSDYEQAFTFRHHTVFCKSFDTTERDAQGDEIKTRAVLYYDMELAKQEMTDFVQRTQASNEAQEHKKEIEEKRRAKNKGRMSGEDFASLQPVDVAKACAAHPQIGTFTLYTDRSAEEIDVAKLYALYKTRQQIEEAFKAYDHEIQGHASGLQDQYAVEGWLFINHLALQLHFQTLDFIQTKELSARYSFRDLIRTLERVRANKIGGEWKVTKITKHVRKLCDDLEITLDTIGDRTP